MNIMHTTASETRTPQLPKRRLYSPELKLQAVAACAQAGASIAGVAMQHGINANTVHCWLREYSQGTLVNRPQTFVPVTLNSAIDPATVQPTACIRVEVKRASNAIVVHWPLAGGAACAQWLGEWLR